MQKSAITVLTILITIVSMGGCPKERTDNMANSQEQPPTASNPSRPVAGSPSEPVSPAPRPEQIADAPIPITTHSEPDLATKEPAQRAKYEEATFAAGCFWGAEASFRAVDGVVATQVGYTGGRRANPTYAQVCTDETGHAEAVEVIYDPNKVSFENLLDIFWKIHDPTTLNRQGPDVGTQYRSAIFYHSPEQKSLAEASMQKLEKARAFKRPIVTQILPAPKFYKAEEYHQQYLEKQGKTSCLSTIH
ncbi:MAG: peptide-methionine (S)-S-oxide reductase MsrA [Sedimentisphaerales bacterium]|nr:peptide-methionine (S)-S-oxide reductase MsrA [Sedimentisphaerales bacterium]